MGYVELLQEIVGVADSDNEETARTTLEPSLKKLTDPDRKILSLHFGLECDSKYGLTLQAIGKQIGLSGTQTRHRYRGICWELRKMLRERTESRLAMSGVSDPNDPGVAELLRRVWPLLLQDLSRLSLEELILIRENKDSILRRFEKLRQQLGE